MKIEALKKQKTFSNIFRHFGKCIIISNVKANLIPLEFLDQVLLTPHSLTPVDIGGWLVFDHLLDTAILRKAIQETLEEFPHLGSRIIFSGDKAFFDPLETSSPPLEVMETEKIGESEVPEAVKNLFRTPIQPSIGPMLKFLQLSSREKTILAISVNHSACDGRGISYLLHALAERYTALIEGKKSERPRGRNERCLKILYRERPVSAFPGMVLDNIRQGLQFTVCRSPDRLPGVRNHARPDYTAIFFFEEEVKLIKNKVKNSGITVNDLFLASLVRTCRQCLGKLKTLRIHIAQDLRPFKKQDEKIFWEHPYGWLPVGNFSGMFFVEFKDEEISSDPVFLQTAAQKTRIHKRRQTTLNGNLLWCLPFPPLFFPLLNRWIAKGNGINLVANLFKSTTILSNLGTTPAEFYRFGNTLPLSFSFALPLVSAAGIVVAASGVGNAISLTLTHPENYGPTGDFAKILKANILV